MQIRQPAGFGEGYTPITGLAGPHPDMLLDFGILKLAGDGRHASRADLERAYLLLGGEAQLQWEGGTRRIARRSLFDEPPWCLHLPAGSSVTLTAGEGGAELASLATANPRCFAPVLYSPQQCRSEDRGLGTLRETATRLVRTVMDNSTAPSANLVLGEAINYPGKWSSYPPHHHPQPEIYHYRFLPARGFGLTAIGERAYVLADGDTVLIREGEVHPQAAAPGYAMYYLWVIRHLDGRRYVSPTFLPEHAWTLDAQAVIWPDEEKS